MSGDVTTHLNTRGKGGKSRYGHGNDLALSSGKFTMITPLQDFLNFFVVFIINNRNDSFFFVFFSLTSDHQDIYISRRDGRRKTTKGEEGKRKDRRERKHTDQSKE